MKTDNIVTVKIENDRPFRILQLSDTQIIDATQSREPDMLMPENKERWAPEFRAQNCYQIIQQLIEQTNPDLILLTGDLVYGKFDDDGSNFLDLAAFMGSLKIPWAPIFGNHDRDSIKGGDWQAAVLEKAPYCLFKTGNLSGLGNYAVVLENDKGPIRVFFLMDSNVKTGVYGLQDDHTEWMQNVLKNLREKNADISAALVTHIQPKIFETAFTERAEAQSADVSNFWLEQNGTDFGYIGGFLTGAWDTDFAFWNWAKKQKFDAIIVAHEHQNCGSVLYENIRLQYGLKSSLYDGVNYRLPDGSLKFSHKAVGKPLVGGTVMQINQNNGALLSGQLVFIDI